MTMAEKEDRRPAPHCPAGKPAVSVSNMPTLWQNCVMQFSTEIARKAWIWFAETRGTGMLFDADEYASEVERLVQLVRPVCALGMRHHGVEDDERIDDLMRFILTRHANAKFGGNVTPSFLQLAGAQR